MTKTDKPVETKYNFPVFGTQGGGLARPEGKTFVFVEVPKDFPDIKVGDPVHEMWDLAPANELAREFMRAQR